MIFVGKLPSSPVVACEVSRAKWKTFEDRYEYLLVDDHPKRVLVTDRNDAKRNADLTSDTIIAVEAVARVNYPCTYQ
jgi:hypothetical protein